MIWRRLSHRAKGSRQLLLVSSNSTWIRCRDFTVVCPNALAASTTCSVLSDRGFSPHFSLLTEFSLSAWGAKVDMACVYPPLWPACWVQCIDRSRRNVALFSGRSSSAAQDRVQQCVVEIYMEVFKARSLDRVQQWLEGQNILGPYRTGL